MTKIDFTALPLPVLTKLGFLRWGREPAPNCYLIPAKYYHRLAPGQTLYGIDGKPYVVGVNEIDPSDQFGYLAYGVKIESDTKPGLPEVPPAQLAALSRRDRRKLERESSKGRGVFLP